MVRAMVWLCASAAAFNDFTALVDYYKIKKLTATQKD